MSRRSLGYVYAPSTLTADTICPSWKLSNMDENQSPRDHKLTEVYSTQS